MELDAQQLPNISTLSSNQVEFVVMESQMDPNAEVDAVTKGENAQQHVDDWLKIASEDATTDNMGSRASTHCNRGRAGRQTSTRPKPV
jgi:hypothetical protein